MTLAEPLWLHLLWVLPGLALLLWRAEILGNRARTSFARPPIGRPPIGRTGPAPGEPPGRRLARMACLAGAMALTALALAGPRYGHEWREARRRGVDLMVALDCSRSMLAADLAPDRLTWAKRKVMDLAEALRGDRVGLVAFAGTAFVQCPLTLDHGALRLFLDTLGPEAMPVGGTDLEAALDAALKGFDPRLDTDRAIVLITDGEPTAGDALAAARRAAQAGVRVFCLGLGAEGGAPVPDPKAGFKKERDGSLKLARLDLDTLRAVAEATGGASVRAEASGRDVEALYEREIRGRMRAREIEDGPRRVEQDRFQWFAAGAALLLFVELLCAPPLWRGRRP